MNQISESETATARLGTHFLEAGAGDAVLLVHGNLSNGDVWREQLELLPAGLRGIAPDLRGFGGSEPAPIDATRGLRDFADDLAALLDALSLDRAHVAGHSLGGGVAMRLALDRPERVRSLVLVAPVSPHGFGGTRADGSPCAPDWAGSGAGVASPDLVARMRAGDRGDGHPAAPRSVVRTLFFSGPEAVRDEERLLDGILQTRVGDDHYPGDVTPSEHWPGAAPGKRGVLNALSPRFCDLTAFGDDPRGGPVLWVRGDRDAIVSDASLVDLGHLGALGAVPGWPGDDVFPAQPMVAQTRALLERRSGFREEVLAGAGHFPFVERPQEFARLLAAHVEAAR